MAIETPAGTEFPYVVKFSVRSTTDLVRNKQRWNWLYEHIGQVDCDWNHLYSNGYYFYCFKTESDAVRFKLTWL